MEEKFKTLRDRQIEHSSYNHSLYSLHPTVSRLLGVMYYYEKPMTLDDMKEELQMSKASMSNAVRELLEIGLVEKVWEKGERKDLYVVEQDNYETFIKFFTYQWKKPIMPNINFLKKSIDELNTLLEQEELDENIRELVYKDLEKLQAGIEYFEWISRIVDLFESHEIFKYVPKKPVKEN